MEDFQNYFRMPEPVYEELLCLVTSIIAKQDTCMREAISPHERLSVTLRFLRILYIFIILLYYFIYFCLCNHR
nr:unnamed protein product [Callosobruchus analis]